MEYKVSLTRLADHDLTRIWQFIAKDNPGRTTSFCLELAREAYSLKDFPLRSTESPTRPSVRKLPYKNYLIYYRVNGLTRTIEILRFWHGARDQRHLRLKEEAAAGYQSTKLGA
jgi:plasmid stabilization system protein ParE